MIFVSLHLLIVLGIWDFMTGKLKFRLANAALGAIVTHALVNKDGTYIVAAESGTMCASKRDRNTSEQLFVKLYSIYLSLCIQPADPKYSELFLRHILYNSFQIETDLSCITPAVIFIYDWKL